MIRLAHLSDLHFGRTDASLLAPLEDELARARPDLVVISGDLTLQAREREFREAAAFIRALPAPCFVVPGNHDIPSHHALERLVHPFRRWRSHIGTDLEPTWIDSRVALVGLNTVQRASWRINWSHGHIGRRHLARVEHRLAALPPGPVRVVVGHHPFFAPDPLLQNRVLRRSDEALRMFRRHRVRLVLAGHLHRAFMHELPGDDPAWPLMVVHGGTTISTRLRGESNAFNIIDLGADGAVRVEARVWTDGGWRGRAHPMLPAPS